ncbi:ABC transporter ATP-binding protein [Cupriavidus plantarum]|uniref:ABC transporter ATP-binding protein n=1 Tax=Cupriavidus plantarum TaxID=942865 RepID=UPI001B2DA00E|nr:ABC transporter ATP-binding protein [Cupriavidus plantarum]CAG2138624.1 High-affinity branched-chain amino acid transport ATP-binding protein LivF [Cupriavidus plantarum]SMR85845.1 amino acid/amide ABC transporter ATP-binding protein 2, HAAT family [Cupriavidus plantarum]
MTREGNVLLSVSGLSAAYGKRAVLHGISLEVRQGEIVALVGANGAGKTTTLSAIMGLLPAVSGSIEFDGTSFLGQTEPAAGLAVERRVARGISLVQEGRQTVPQLTVAENLAIGAYLRRDADVAADIAHLYALFPRLAERRRQLAGTLSGGEQQMLAIGRALMARPRLLLLDEPSMGLAPKIIAQIFRIIEQIRAEGTTVLLVEQNAREALAMADRAYVLEQGRVVLSGDGATVAADPAVLDAYLGGRQAA